MSSESNTCQQNGAPRAGLNPNLGSLATDNLYHLGYTTKDDLANLFGDVKVTLVIVCVVFVPLVLQSRYRYMWVNYM